VRCKIGNTDLSQIECRVLNTLAGQWDVVERFRSGADVYAALASSVYGYPVTKETHPMERQAGKVLELQAGYGSGEDKIRFTLRQNGVVIDENKSYRDGYRGTHPFVKALWEKANLMLWALRDGHTIQWGPPGQTAPCMYVHDRRVFHVPSGLWIDYTTLDRIRTDDGEEIWRMKVREGYRKMYGARLIENVVQFLARIVITDAMKRVAAMGYKIPLTVHDNIYTVIPANRGDFGQQLEAIRQAVAQPVPWLEHCPIAAESELLDALA
jgi:DNA polymerase